MNSRNLLYALTCLSFSVILGAAIYEHVAVWPAAFAEPPKSLSMFQGAYRLDAAPFWMIIHPITVVLFIITLAMHWKTERRKFLLFPIVAYVIILAITFTYFVPTLTSIINSTNADTVDEKLKDSGQLWIVLSIVRAVVLFAMGMTILLGLTKPSRVS